MLALVHQLPRGKGITYRFDSVDVAGQPRVKLTAVEAPAEPEQAEPEEPAAPAAIVEAKTGLTAEDVERALAAAEADRLEDERPKGPADVEELLEEAPVEAGEDQGHGD